MTEKNRKIYGYLLMVIDLLYIGLARMIDYESIDLGLYIVLTIVVIIENSVFFMAGKRIKDNNDKNKEAK